jgi:hypothetical protein
MESAAVSFSHLVAFVGFCTRIDHTWSGKPWSFDESPSHDVVLILGQKQTKKEILEDDFLGDRPRFSIRRFNVMITLGFGCENASATFGAARELEGYGDQDGWDGGWGLFLAVAAPGRQDSLGVFPELFGSLEELLERPGVFVLAVIGGVGPADLGAIEVDTATVVAGQVIAAGHDQEIPHLFLDVDHRLTVGEVPANRVELVPFGRLVDG